MRTTTAAAAGAAAAAAAARAAAAAAAALAAKLPRLLPRLAAIQFCSRAPQPLHITRAVVMPVQLRQPKCPHTHTKQCNNLVLRSVGPELVWVEPMNI